MYGTVAPLNVLYIYCGVAKLLGISTASGAPVPCRDDIARCTFSHSSWCDSSPPLKPPSPPASRYLFFLPWSLITVTFPGTCPDTCPVPHSATRHPYVISPYSADEMTPSDPFEWRSDTEDRLATLDLSLWIIPSDEDDESSTRLPRVVLFSPGFVEPSLFCPVIFPPLAYYQHP